MDKCVCGYVSASPWEQEFDKTITDEMTKNKDFIQIKGSFHKDNGSYYGGLVEVSLCACPECGTVRMVNF